MDNLLYILLTKAVCLVSFVIFIVLITYHIIKKVPFKLKSYIIFIMCTIGMYLFIPSNLLYLGLAYQQPERFEQAIKFSINPYEKRLAYKYLAELYADDILNKGIKDGNKAIDYMEKALKGEYKKYPAETYMLAYWYSIKGDYKKTIELNEALGRTKGISLRNMYIMQNEYEKALKTFSDNKKSIDCFLKAALYREIGDNKKAEETIAEAQKIYDRLLKNVQDKERFKANSEKYNSIELYKNWIRQQQKEYKFR